MAGTSLLQFSPSGASICDSGDETNPIMEKMYAALQSERCTNGVPAGDFIGGGAILQGGVGIGTKVDLVDANRVEIYKNVTFFGNHLILKFLGLY